MRWINSSHGPSMKERGQALIIILMILVFAGAGSIIAFLSPSRHQLKSDERTALSMAAAKDALIGYAASSAVLPGQLPCPDLLTETSTNTPNDGIADERIAGGICPSNIGRLPWRTLGLENSRDGTGERLWYAVSPSFTGDCCIDVDTTGSLKIYQDLGANKITDYAVAVILAPGSSLPAQLRGSANTNSPGQYLDAWNGINNASGTSFISVSAKDLPPPGFNDRILVVSNIQLMTVVEIRVAREMRALLRTYRENKSFYPWAANYLDDSSVADQRSGGVPMRSALPDSWADAGVTIPAWMIGSNNWGKRFYYAVSGADAPIPPSPLPTMTVDAVAKALVLITPGPRGNSVRASLNDYFEDAENRDGNDLFITPTSTAHARNRVYTCPSSGSC